MEKLYPNFTQLADAIEDIQKKIPMNELEVESRLGCYSENHSQFNANIGEDYFKKIQTLLSCLDQQRTQAQQEIIDQRDFFYKNLRLTVQKDQKTCIEKNKLCKFGFAFEHLPLDIRFTISHEKKLPIEQFPVDNLHTLFCRHKKRLRYSLENVYLELTEVVEHHPNGKMYKSYEYEIEVMDNSKETDFFYTFEDIFLKCIDAVAYCKRDFIKSINNNHDLSQLFPLQFIQEQEDDEQEK